MLRNSQRRTSHPHRARSHRRTQLPVWSIAVVVFAAVAASGGLMTAAHLEENDAFCASCHTQPESAYFDRSHADTPVDLASWHSGQSTRCIDCHSGRGVLGRLGGMSVGAGDLLAYLSGNARQPAPLTVPISDGHCLKCHAMTTQTQDFNRHFHAFLPRWQAADPQASTCVDCHTAHVTGGDPAIMYMQEQQVVSVCQHCHLAVGVGG